MPKKTVWFINDYAGSPYHGMEFRNYYIAKELVKHGYEVYIISASYMHLFKTLPSINGSFTHENLDGINYVWVKVPKYKSSTDKKRVLKWFVFSVKLLLLPFENLSKPDVIVASPMATFLALPSYLLAKKYKAKFFYEVKDIWPLSLMELGGFSSKNPIIAMMSFCEKFAIKKSDKVISSLQNYGKHLEQDLNLKKEFEWICNGVDLEELESAEPLSKELLGQIPKDKFIVGYTGTVGIANSISTFCEAADILREEKEILFIIVGDGKQKENLVKTYAHLDNILFVSPIPKDQIQSILKIFDLCFIGLRKEKLFKYGVSPNKLFDYMYSSKPILYAIESGENNIVSRAKCGVSIKAEDSRALANEIYKLSNTSKESLDQMGTNGRRYVLENFTYSKLAKKYDNLIKEVE